MLAAGVPIAVVSKRLGHSTISLTLDTYSHLLQGVSRDAAERAAALVPRALNRHRTARVTNDQRAPETTQGLRANAGGPELAAPPTGLEPVTLRLTVPGEPSRVVRDDHS